MSPPSALPNQIAHGYSGAGRQQPTYDAMNFIYNTHIQELNFKEVIQKFSNIVINDGDDPSEVWRSLKMFYYDILAPEMRTFEAYAVLENNREARLKAMAIKAKLILEFPAYSISSFEGFVFLYHPKESTSYGCSNHVSRFCLDEKVTKKISYKEIPNCYFTQKVTNLFEKFESECLELDTQSLRISIHTVDEYFNIFKEGVTSKTLAEGNIIMVLHLMVIAPVERLLDIVLGKRLRMLTDCKKCEELKISSYRKGKGHGDLLKLINEKFYTYPDRTLSLENQETNSINNLMNIEINIYNCIKLFTDRDGKQYDTMFLQLLSHMISGKFALSAITDGYNILILRLDITCADFTAYVSNAKGFKFIPIEYKVVSILPGSQGIPNAKRALCAVLYDEIEKSKMDTYIELKQNRIELLKDRCLKSTAQLIESFKKWTQTYYEESMKFKSHRIAYESNSRHYKRINIYSNGPEDQPQMLTLTKKLCEEMFGVKIVGNWNKRMLLKIFDPSRYQIQNYVPELESEILDTKRAFESMFHQEVEAYDTIQRFNSRSKTMINTPKRYATGELKLEITGLSYYAGHYILYDFISGRPTRKSHYRQGMKQLQLLKKAKITLDRIEPSNIYYENGKFYISDLGYSAFDDECDYSGPASNYGLNLHRLKLREKEAKF